MKIIGYIQTDYITKFGIPRQSGIVKEAVGKIVFEKEYRVPEAFRELEGFSHLWLLWQFSEAVREDWSPTVRPPMLGGNKRVGVFATRSPFRPNNIGLSAVKLERVEFTKEEGPVLWVSGADLMNGTPIYDVKPYLSYADSIPDAKGGFSEQVQREKLTVEASDELIGIVPEEKRTALMAVLADDPRPTYQNEPDRVYGFNFGGYEVKFTVDGCKLFVTDITKTE